MTPSEAKKLVDLMKLVDSGTVSEATEKLTEFRSLKVYKVSASRDVSILHGTLIVRTPKRKRGKKSNGLRAKNR